jgi:hypothetical protein
MTAALLLALLLGAPPPGHGAGTRCSACHVTSSWKQVSFDHSRLGFPLEGRHLAIGCRACHVSGDFRAPLPTTCAACHTDVHLGQLGARCGRCHDATDWSSRFDVSAHQRTNFPLTGRHAAIPCEECHLAQRDRKFTRSTVGCFACHQADYARTAGTAFDHARSGFGTDCKSCHFTSTFKKALFAAHEVCFQIDVGPHAGISCLDCHTSLANATVTGACNTGTASCIRCHSCASVQAPHTQVAGFQCKDRKCYECHSFTGSAGIRARTTRGVR